MAIELHIELAFSEGSEEKYMFLYDYLPDSLDQLNIKPELHISEYPSISKYISNESVDTDLFDAMNYVIGNSRIKKFANNTSAWYICVIVGSRHMDDFLGIMFDYRFSRESRNGCAVFEKSINDFADKHNVAFERVFSRTLLHEIGHCLNLPHDYELKLMSPTYELISSRKQPGWNQNIFYEFSKENSYFIEGNPHLAKPGGGMNYERILEEERVNFADSINRKDKSIRIILKNCDLDNTIPTFELGSNISLMMELENVSLRSIRIPLSLHQNDENLKISITHPEGFSIPYRKSVLGCGNSWKSISIRPKEKRVISLNLFFDSEGYLFQTPGTYMISCSVRKFGKQNIWYKSNSEELNIVDPSPEKKSIFQKVFEPSFMKYFLLGGGNKSGFLKKCNNYLNDSSIRESGFTVPIAWIYLHSLKYKVLKETDPSKIKGLRKKIIKVYSQLLQEETSKIRKGKLSYELQQLLESSKVKTKKLSSFIQSQDQEDYLNFKKMHISRIYSPENRANYESKIVK